MKEQDIIQEKIDDEGHIAYYVETEQIIYIIYLNKRKFFVYFNKLV
jgi:hypothetical protein